MRVFDNSDQMKAFMKKESRRLNISPTNTYHTFLVRSILERVSKLSNTEIIVKGSAAETAYLGRLVRSITDLDIASESTFDDTVCLLSEILTPGDQSSFKLSYRSPLEITKTGIHKLRLNAKFEQILQPFDIDFQENYGRLIEPTRTVMPPIFEGDQPFEIYTPSYEEYLAEKLCIIVESDKEDVANTRAKDFYDIYELHGSRYDSEKLTEYFRKMLALRGKKRIEDADTTMLDQAYIDKHQTYWDSAKKHYDFLDHEIKFPGAVYYTRAVIREQLQKNGQEMPDSIKRNPVKSKIYRVKPLSSLQNKI